MHVSSPRLKQNFTRAAREYDVRAEFQHVQTRRVLDAALMVIPERATVVDVGCGTGYFALAARQKRPGWRVLGVDIAAGMCEIARARCVAINADAARLPLADASADALVSSLCYQWVADHAAAFAEITRVLKPGGRAIIASLGEASLRELRACAAYAHAPLNLLPMRDFADMRGALQRAGLEVTLADRCKETRYYPSVAALMDSMRNIGAGNNFAPSRASFLPPKRWAALVAEYEKQRSPDGIPATWEHHFFILHKPL